VALQRTFHDRQDLRCHQAFFAPSTLLHADTARYDPIIPMPLQLDIFHLMKLHRAGGLRLIFYLISNVACIGMVKLQLSEPNFRGESTQLTTGTLVPNLFLFVCVSSHLHLPLVFIYILLGYLALR